MNLSSETSLGDLNVSYLDQKIKKVILLIKI